jgi:HEAT repeats
MNISDEVQKVISYRKENWRTLPLEVSEKDKLLLQSLNPYRCFMELQSVFLEKNGETLEEISMQGYAYRCILILSDEIKLNFLISLLYYSEYEWRGVACEALMKIPNPTSILALANKLITDEHGDVRYAAAEALEEIGDETALPFLEYARDHDEGEDWATFKVSKMAAQAIQAILERGKSGDSSS